MKRILLIYTGGTIGMIRNKINNKLIPFTLESLLLSVPELQNDDVKIEYESIEHPIDSSNMSIKIWVEIADVIYKNHNKFNGFVILHGTDTMSYTASALSFMLENVNKPVILTGSQIPIGVRRTDAKENLITAIEIAGIEKINEVCIYFENQLFRGNRTTKINTEDFEAFKSPNYPALAEVGVQIKFNNTQLKTSNKKLIVHKNLSNDIAILKLYPGIKLEVIELIMKNVKGVVIESFGAGNAINDPGLVKLFENMIKRGKILINVSQCIHGNVISGEYESSAPFENKDIINGKDITTEAAVTKLMYLLGSTNNDNKTRIKLNKNLRGEVTC
jgi:L-asparaginase